jgi:uncharacterized protein
MPELDLQPRHLRLLLDLLAEYAPDAEVWAYGSRAIGQSHEASDLDLVLRNPSHPETPQKNLRALRDALTESNLPILVQVFDWAEIPDQFRREIQRQHALLVCREHIRQ